MNAVTNVTQRVTDVTKSYDVTNVMSAITYVILLILSLPSNTRSGHTKSTRSFWHLVPPAKNIGTYEINGRRQLQPKAYIYLEEFTLKGS